jgi:hypothetical protein
MAKNGTWPKKLGTSTLLGSFEGDWARYRGPLLQEGAEIERVDSGSRTHCWQLTTIDGGVEYRSGPFTKKYILDEIREMSTPAVNAARPKKSKSTGLAAQYTRYRQDWKQSPRLVARFKKGKQPPRS